jgi:hypothetical protein
VTETSLDGTLIPEASFETLQSEDSLSKRVDVFGAENPTIVTLCASGRYLRIVPSLNTTTYSYD